MERVRRLSKKSLNPPAWGVYLFLVMAIGLVLFWRFPNNVVYANFFAEDGSVFLQNVINKGWMEATITPFNGYSIVGLYLLCGLGWIINFVFMGGGLVTLPAGFALAAMVFMAAVIALPYLLFARTFGRGKMVLVVVASALMPLPLSPHVVIGTIGNQKWIVLYLAFLLVLYRVVNHRKLHWATLIAVDGTLLLAAYTNSTVYALIPLAFLPYVHEYWTKRKDKGVVAYVRGALRQKAFLSLVTLGVLLAPQVIFVLLNGIPKLPGYLDTPFQVEKTIELFINRTYLFGVTHIVNGHMNDLIVLVLFVILLGLGWKLLRGKERLAFLFGLYTAGVASLLFVVNRPGVTDHFHNYQPSGSGPDQFFYAQTLVMYVPLVLVAFAVAAYLGNRRLRRLLTGMAAAFFVVSGLVSNALPGAAWRNASVFENDAGTFVDQAIVSCASDTSPTRITLYPYKNGQFSLYAPRDKVCNSRLRQYQTSTTDLGLAPNNNDHLALRGQEAFMQTFTADRDGLNGIKLFVSNFGKTYRMGEYRLNLLDAACQNVLRETTIPEKLIDNAFYNARFEPVPDSAHQVYCFTVKSPTSGHDPIAVQRSAPNIYPFGLYSENAIPQVTDVVFAPLYTQQR